jgi:hypothetical protein
VFAASRSSSASVHDSATRNPVPKAETATVNAAARAWSRLTTNTVTSPLSASWVATASSVGTAPKRAVS